MRADTMTRDFRHQFDNAERVRLAEDLAMTDDERQEELPIEAA